VRLGAGRQDPPRGASRDRLDEAHGAARGPEDGERPWRLAPGLEARQVVDRVRPEPDRLGQLGIGRRDPAGEDRREVVRRGRRRGGQGTEESPALGGAADDGDARRRRAGVDGEE
jgi:hypothetical protein